MALQPQTNYSRQKSNETQPNEKYIPLSTKIGNKKPRAEDQYRLYPQRWLVLFSFSCLTATSAWIWAAFSPIASSVSLTYWNVPIGYVDALPATYLYTYAPLSFLSLFAMNRFGLRWGLRASCLFNAVGAGIRYVFLKKYWAVYIGTLFCALAQTFTLSAPPLISGNWFGCKERGTATAIGVLMNQVGIAIGLGATMVVNFYLVDESQGTSDNLAINETMLVAYTRWQLYASLLCVVFVLAFLKSDHPPTPPSEAAAIATVGRASKERKEHIPLTGHSSVSYNSIDVGATESKIDTNECDSLIATEQSLGYILSLKHFCFTVPSGIPFTVSYGMSVGVYYTIPSFVSQYVLDWSPQLSGALGLAYTVAGVAGSFVAGRALDSPRCNYRTFMSWLLVGTLVSLGCLTVCLHMYIEMRVLVFFLEILVGLFVAALIPVGFEYGTAMAYPADEAAVAGILECSAELSAFIMTTVGGYFERVGVIFNVIMLCSVAGSLLILLLGVLSESKRPNNRDKS